ncbi:CoA-transferase subunit beta [Azospirillum canadense]|uniref:CoA-transferase subunit beta n=1 Tax=Azospirillum canadense TaxID=403962 RepID=UPI00222612E9|nr:CoA-transferase [Azospirillum canadense]MCW2242123.1 glutaconate CoA-transferase subunit B [Azospirillum canadense]
MSENKIVSAADAPGSTAPATTNELVTAVIAREIRDGDLAFVGVGTNGRAFTLAVGIPLTAVRLAQMLHAPSAAVYWGNLLEPDLSSVPADLKQDSFTRWQAAASPSDTGVKCDMLARRAFDVCFDSAAQVDRFGNLNITAIGDYRKPKVRLVGCLAQPEHFAFVPRPIVVVDLDRRVFVEKVDFITSVGHLHGGRSREEAGLQPGGPHLVVTDKAILDFEPESKLMRIRSLHPGVTLEEVLDRLSFRPVVPDSIPTTPLPTERELDLIRRVIDPNRVLLRV